MKIKRLKEIIMNLDDDYEVVMEDVDDKAEVFDVDGVEVSVYSNEIIFRNYNK